MPSPIPIRPTSPLPPLPPPPAASVAAAVGASQLDATSSNDSGGTTVIGGGGRPTVIGAPHVVLLASFNAAQPDTSDTNPSGTIASSNVVQAVADDTNFNVGSPDDTNFNVDTNFNEDFNDAIAQIAADDHDNRLEDDLDEDTTTQNTTDASKSNDTNDKAKNGNAMAVGKPNPAQRETDKVATSARKKPKKAAGAPSTASKKRAIQIRPGRRVKITAARLRHRVKPGHPGWDIVTNCSNNLNFHGTVTTKKQSNGMYNVSINKLPANHQIVDLPRGYITVMEDGEEEKAYDHAQDTATDTTDDCHGNGPKKRVNHEKASIDAFLSLSTEDQKVASAYVHRHGTDGKKSVAWTILEDSEQITQDAMDPEVIKKSPFKKDIPWDKDRRKVNYNKIFFDHFLPDLTGKSALLDEWLSDPRCPVFSMAQQDRIKFNRPDDDDPDCLVSCYLQI